MSDEELQEAKRRSRSPLVDFHEEYVEPPRPFPWKALLLALIALGVATPFALRAFRRTVSELPSDQKPARPADSGDE